MPDKVQFELTLSSPEFAKMLGASGLLTPESINRIVNSGGKDDKPQEVSPDPSFMSLFKPLLAVNAVAASAEKIVQNSSVANTYLGNMGKMFGSALDLLLIPFLPIFNLIMAGISKLIQWLVASGVLEQIRDNVLGVIDWVKRLWDSFRNWSPKEIGSTVKDGLKSAFDSFRENPIAFGGTALGLLAAGSFGLKMGWKALGLIPGAQPLLRSGGRAIGNAIGLGRWGTLAGAAATQLIAGPTIAAGALYDLANDGHGTGTADRWGRVGKWATFGAGAGLMFGGAGAVPGALIGAGVGGLAELIDANGVFGFGKGWMDHEGRQRQASGASGASVHNENSNNTINNYVTVNAGASEKEIADTVARETTKLQKQMWAKRR